MRINFIRKFIFLTSLLLPLLVWAYPVRAIFPVYNFSTLILPAQMNQVPPGTSVVINPKLITADLNMFEAVGNNVNLPSFILVIGDNKNPAGTCQINVNTIQIQLTSADGSQGFTCKLISGMDLEIDPVKKGIVT